MIKNIAKNPTAKHNYTIIDTLEAGIVLTGTEIKSIRNGKVNLKDSYAEIKNGEVFVLGMNVTPYDFGNRYNQDPLRVRKLLLHKREIAKLLNYTTREGYTLVPLKVYINERGLMKMQIAVAKGKKLYDKRDSLAKKDAERHVQKTLKAYNQ